MKKSFFLLSGMVSLFIFAVIVSFPHSADAAKLIAKGSMNSKHGSSTASMTSSLPKMIAKGDQEISRRIDALNKLSARVQQMNRISASEKTDLSTSIQSQITSLTNLKTKIDADTDLATLKANIKSVTDSYRILALILPQGNILAASDRVNTIADTMTGIITKIQARLTTLQSKGKDVSKLQAMVSDMTTKISDAKTQALNAQTSVSALTSDNGVTSVADSNKATLTQARGDIKTATADLKNARQTLGTIVSSIKETVGTSTASTTISASSTQ